MDSELLIALIVLWAGSTAALILFLQMWFSNDGAAFHPHSVDVENRHPTFLVVNSKTECKRDCAIKSVSAFVAPRGSSSSKHFTALCMMISIAGMLGTTRWYFVRDATQFQFILAFFGFLALTFVAGFELDVAPERFLEDKQMITGWFIEKLGMEKQLPFRLGPHNKEFRHFIRSSPEIYHLYEEDRYLNSIRAQNIEIWTSELIWQSMHVIGAMSYVTLVPAAILLNDIAEEKVAWITGFSFCLFCAMGYFTGNYVPVARYFRCWILTWNPFLREPHFMLKLKRSIEAYVKSHNLSQDIHGCNHHQHNNTSNNNTSTAGEENFQTAAAMRRSKNRISTAATKRKQNQADERETLLLHNLFDEKAPMVNTPDTGAGTGTGTGTGTGAGTGNGTGKKGKGSRKVQQKNASEVHSNGNLKSDSVAAMCQALPSVAGLVNAQESALVDKCLDTPWLRYARHHPAEYLQILSYIMVMSELISMMTPCVAMGIQWITALCDGPPLLAIIELGTESVNCLLTGGVHCTFNTTQLEHCILRH